MWRMLDNLLGWRKAPKCKKLVKALQCRLKLLKNKRAFIVNQLRGDVAHLLQLGFHQIAFRKVELLIKDKTTVEAYDLLYQYCEFVTIHLSYIRKHKDCPNDIIEAVSTLIFSSARFGELPELQYIRKLFRERYGPRFITTALELLPGNLVSRQMKEMVVAKTIPDDVKYGMLDEIDCSLVRRGQLLLQHKPESKEAAKDTDQTSSFNGKAHSCSSDATSKSRISIGNAVQDLESEESDELLEQEDITEMVQIEYLPEERIYLDNIHEFVPLMSENGQHLQDQRVFIFTSTIPLPINEKTTKHTIDSSIKKHKLCQEKSSKQASMTSKRTKSNVMNFEYHDDLNHQSIEWRDKSLADHELDECKGGAITLYAGRHDQEDHRDNNILRPRHIHPKLPDYDELTAKFTVIKRANLLQKKQNVCQ